MSNRFHLEHTNTMKATLDTHFWKQLLSIPGVGRCAWFTSNDQVWSIAELRSLLGSTPPGMTIYLWKFHCPVHPVARPRGQKRSFFHTNEIWSRTIYSADVAFQGRLLWFDLAALDQGCAEDFLDQLKGGQFLMSTGMIIEDDQISKNEFGARISSTILQAWNHQSAHIRPYEWTDETWQDVHRLLPGFVYPAQDMNVRRCFMTLDERVIPWLMSRSTAELDPAALFQLGVEIGAPGYPF